MKNHDKTINSIVSSDSSDSFDHISKTFGDYIFNSKLHQFATQQDLCKVMNILLSELFAVHQGILSASDINDLKRRRFLTPEQQLINLLYLSIEQKWEPEKRTKTLRKLIKKPMLWMTKIQVISYILLIYHV